MLLAWPSAVTLVCQSRASLSSNLAKAASLFAAMVCLCSLVSSVFGAGQARGPRLGSADELADWLVLVLPCPTKVLLSLVILL